MAKLVFLVLALCLFGGAFAQTTGTGTDTAEIINNVETTVLGIFGDLTDTITKSIDDATVDISSAVGGLKTTIDTISSTVIKLVGGPNSVVGRSLKTTFDLLKSNIDTALKAVNQLETEITKTFRNVVSGLADPLAKFTSSLTSAVASLLNGATGASPACISALKADIAAILEKLRASIKLCADDFTKRINDLVKEVVDGVKRVTDQINAALTKLTACVNNNSNIILTVSCLVGTIPVTLFNAIREATVLASFIVTVSLKTISSDDVITCVGSAVATATESINGLRDSLAKCTA